MRKYILILWLSVLSCGVFAIFWYQEWKYNLPTPVPVNYKTVKTGDPVDLSGKLSFDNNKPVFIHFFNPNCPCSKFNIPHFQKLVKKYGNKVNFAIVVLNDNKRQTAADIQDKFDLQVPVLFDSSIAVVCGVYSTPQAVIINAQHKLYYRGNYNKSRYCTDIKSNYAQMAIDSLLTNNSHPLFSPAALTAYGCQFSNCKKND